MAAPDSLPETPVSRRIESTLEKLGSAASWIWLVLLAVIVVNVISRYAFGQGRIEFEELQWHLYSVGFLVGIVVAVGSDAHVRVDVLREGWHPRTRAWVELYGLLLLFFPFVALVLIPSVPFVTSSFATGEVSVSAGGLPYRWALKGVLAGAFALLALAGVARLLRVGSFLFGSGPGSAGPGR